MKRKGVKDTSVTDDQTRLELENARKNRAHATPKKNRLRRESAVIDNEATVLSREILVTAREKSADLRDDVTRLRDTAAQVMPADRVNMLQIVKVVAEERVLTDE